MSSTPRDWDPEAEASVLGSILLDPPCLAEVSLILKSWDFYSPANRGVFDVFVDMEARGVALDSVTLHSELDRRSLLEKVGGADFIADLLELVPSPANAEHYARIVKDHARRRRYKELLAETAKNLDSSPTGEVSDNLLERIKRLEERDASGELYDSPVSRLAETHVEWLWNGYIPAGMFSLVIGDGGLGKGTVLVDIAARVSNGSPMPDGGSARPAGPVLWLTAEDDPHSIVKPRLMAAGADLDLVRIVRERDGDGSERELVLDVRGVERLAELVERRAARLVVVDPIGAYLPPTIDEHRDADLRRVLGPLSRMCERTGCSVVGIKHLNKNAGASGTNRISGSVGWGNAARSVLAVGLDPDDIAEDPRAKRRVLAVVKLNVGVPACSQAFRLASEPGDANGPAHVAWLGPSELAAGRLLCGQLNEEEHEERDAAIEFLRERLAEGAEVPSAAVLSEARKRGLSHRTLTRARKACGVKAKKTQDGWVLHLPKP